MPGGVLAGQAAQMNAAFLWWHRRRTPYVALKLAASLDGKIAEREGDRTDLTGAEARIEVMRLRASHDAILVGAGTVRVDDPLLTVREVPAPRRAPLRVVLDSAAMLSTNSRLVATVAEAPVLVLAGAEADPDRVETLRATGVEVQRIERDDRYGLSLPAALDALRDRGCTAVLCEGGAKLAASLLTGGHVQRIHWFVAPRILGPAGVDALSEQMPAVGSWRLLNCGALGNDALIEWSHTELDAVMKEL